MSRDDQLVPPGYRLRLVVNLLNLSTLIGLLIGAIAGARFTPGRDGLILGRGYRLPIPPAPAFTIGNVVLLRIGDDGLAARPKLLIHEARHATQYAWCIGPVMFPLYALAAAWSWLLTGDPASRNVFERLAGLADGGYRERPIRPIFRRG